PQLLEAREPVFLAAVCAAGETIGAAFLDIFTGEFRVTQENGRDSWTRTRAALESYAPRELLFPASLGALIKASLTGKVQTAPLPLERSNGNAHSSREEFGFDVALTPLDDWQWTKDDCFTLLLDHFKVKTLDGYGLAKRDDATRAGGACLRYARETQRAAAEHVTDLVYFEPQDHLVLDSVTVRNLELVESLAGGSGRSLLQVIDETVTGMGARLLRAWLLRP